MRTVVRMSVIALLMATSLQAITYIVPSDRDLVKRSEAIVIATALESHSEVIAMAPSSQPPRSRWSER